MGSFGTKPNQNDNPRPCADCPAIISGHPRRMRCEACAKSRQRAREREWQSSPEARAYKKRYYHAHRVEQKARHSAWLKSPRGRECVIAQRARFKAAHPERGAEYSRRKYQKYRLRYLAKRKQEIKDNPEKWRAYYKARYWRLKALSDPKPRGRPRKPRPAKLPAPGEVFNAKLHENQMCAAVLAAIPRGLDDAMKGDIFGDVVEAILRGEASIETIPAQMTIAIRNYRRMFDSFKTVSIDAPIFAGSNVTIGDNLTYPTA